MPTLKGNYKFVPFDAAESSNNLMIIIIIIIDVKATHALFIFSYMGGINFWGGSKHDDVSILTLFSSTLIKLLAHNMCWCL